MKAELLLKRKDILSEDELIEMVVWQVPDPIEPSEHLFKYRLVYILKGERRVGFDNERGKGDHCHLEGREYPYAFIDVERLIEDFIKEVDKRR